MEYVFRFVYDFVLLFVLFLIIYFVFINKKRKDYTKLKKNDFVKAFIARYDLDVSKIDYKTVLNTVTVINSFIIAFTATLILNINSYIWKVLICFLVVFTLIYSLYELAGRYLKKKEGKKNV